MWNMTVMVQSENCKEGTMESKKEEDKEEAVGLKVKKAVLFPQEAQKGMWPENTIFHFEITILVIFILQQAMVMFLFFYTAL